MHYLVLVVFLATQSAKKEMRNACLIMYSLLLIVFAFMTREGSWDYFGYIEYYRCSISTDCNTSGFEKSFGYISNLAAAISASWGFELTYFFYISVAILLKVFLIKRYSKAVGISIFALICYGYFVHDLTQIRASLSIALLWIACFLFTNKKYSGAALLLIFATFFHTSALLGILIFASTFFSTGLLLWLSFIAVLTGSFAGVQLTQLPDFGIDRLLTYTTAVGSEALTASPFNFYAISMLLLAYIAYTTGRGKLSGIEKLSVNGMLLGISLYFVTSYIPVVPLRVLEILSCLYPFVAGATYKNTSSKMAKLFMVTLFLGLFVNTSVKNNTRSDFILPWHSINTEYMTEIQLNQYEETQGQSLLFGN